MSEAHDDDVAALLAVKAENERLRAALAQARILILAATLHMDPDTVTFSYTVERWHKDADKFLERPLI